MELEEMMELEFELQGLQDVAEHGYNDGHRTDDNGNYEDHPMIVASTARVRDDDDQPLQVSPGWSFSDHQHLLPSDQFDHSGAVRLKEADDQQAADMTYNCFMRSSFDHYHLLDDQHKFSTAVTLAEADAIVRSHECLRSTSDRSNHNDQLDRSRAGSQEDDGRVACSNRKKREKRSLVQRSNSSISRTFPNSNKVRRDRECMIRKRASDLCMPPPQNRRPIIICTYSPKVIHTQPSKFMRLVQSLTGSSETRSRCLNSTADLSSLQDHSSASSSAVAAFDRERQKITSTAPTASNDHDIHNYLDQFHSASTAASMDACHPHPNSSSSTLNSHVIITPKPIRPSPINCSVSMSASNVINSCTSSNHHINQSFVGYTNNFLSPISPNYSSEAAPSNLRPNLTANYFDRRSSTQNIERLSSSTSCCSTIDVCPRGQFSAADPFKISAAGTKVTHLAPIFENWAHDYHNTSFSNLRKHEANLNYLNLSLKAPPNSHGHNLNYLSSDLHVNLINDPPSSQGHDGLPSNHVISAAHSPPFNNSTALPYPCLFPAHRHVP